MGRRIGESSKGGRQNIDWKRIGQWEGLWATFEFIFQIYSSSEIDCFDYFWVFWDFVGIFISAQLLSRVQLFVTPGHTRSPCPSPTPGVYPNSCPLSRCCHPTISSCHPLLLLPSIFPSIRVFSNESAFHIRWPKYWSFNFNISHSNEHSGLIFRMDWLDLLVVQGTLKSLLQHHSSKSSVLWHSAFFIVQLSHPYMITGKTIALTRRTWSK